MIPQVQTPMTMSAERSRADPLREKAVELEAAFLSEMLKGAGLDGVNGRFSGGAGEDQFASLLRDQHAHAIAGAGGIGLAEHIFQALTRGSINAE